MSCLLPYVCWHQVLETVDCREGGLLGPMFRSPNGFGCGDTTQCLPFVGEEEEEEGRSGVREMKHLFLIAFLDANTACPLVRSSSGGWQT
jgi:hypothetical protein